MSHDRLNLLLVEDNEDDYLIVRDLLRDIDAERFALDWAGSYAEGLHAIQTQRHDLILLDFHLSDGTGLELLQETQAVASRAPVIFMTGQGDHAIDVQVMQAGAVDYLVKDRLAADLLERAIRYAVERQKSAAALRASEDRYRTFVENSSEGIWRFELEQPLPLDRSEEEQIAHLEQYAYLAECNEAMARLQGFERPADIMAKRIGEFLSMGEVSDENYLRRLIHNRYRLVTVEAFEIDRQRQSKYVLHHLIGVVENGRLLRIWGSQSDTTEQKRSENAQAQLAAIVEASSDAIISTTLEGLIVTWNKGAEAMYGFTAQEVTGELVSRIIPPERSQEMGSILERTRLGAQVGPSETVRLHKDGRLFDVSLAVSPIRDNLDRVIGISFIARDISEQKRAAVRLRQSEANMAAAQRIAHFGSWEIDLSDQEDINANPLRWSDETFRIFGYEPGSVPVSNELFFHAVPPEEQPAIQETMAAAVAGRRHASFVHRVRHPDGEERVVRETAQYFESAAAGQPSKLVGTVHDITEQQRAEEHIRFQALLLSQVRNAVVATDLAGQIIYWNSFAEALYQWKAEEVVGRNIAEVTSPPESQTVAEQVMCEIRETGSWQGEWLARRKDGGTFHAYVVDTVFQDAKGVVAGLVGVSVDITKRKQTEEALRESEQKFRSIVETTLEGVMTESMDSKITYVNERFCEMFGYDASELVGRDRFFLVDDEDREEALRGVERRRQGIQEQFDRRFRHKNGSLIWGIVSASPIFERDGHLTGSFLTITDITERKRAEEARDRFIAVLDETPDFVGMTDPQGRNLYLNRAARRMMGINETADVTELAIAQCHPDNFAQKIISEGIPTAVLDGVWSGETAVLHRDGHEAPISQIIIAHKDSQGQIQFFSTVGRDITERKRAEVLLTESQQRLALATESAQIGIWDWDVAANRMLWDAQMYALYGIQEQDFSGAYDAWQNGLHPEDRERAEAEILSALDGSRDFHTQFRLVWPNGKIRHIEAHAVVQRDSNSLALRMIGVNWDITDRSQAEDSLREAEREQRQLAARLDVERARLAEAQAIAKVGSWELDLATHALTWSDEIYRIFGCSRAKFRNTYEAFLEFVHPDDRAVVDKTYTDALANRRAYEIDHRVQLDDGSIKFVHERVQTFYDDDGKPIRSLGTTQDITANQLMVEALRKSEYEFRRIVETTNEGVVQVDEGAKITYVNQRYCEMLGYTAEELLGHSTFDQMDEESRVLAHHAFDRRRQGVTEQFDRRLQRKDGALVWAIVSVTPLFNEEGRMVGSLTMTTDITDRKRLETQVRQSEKLAALGELVAGVAHEINNPLAAILGTAELLEMSADPQVREDAQTIQRMSQRVTRIVRSLLTFARPQKEDRREETLNTLVEQTLEMTTHKLRTAGITLTMRLQEPSPVAMANANEVQQVLLNLIVNAEHALRQAEGDKRLVISTGTVPIDGRAWATVSIADNGHGIPDEIRARIFDPFFTTKDVGEGTGLGLSICHGIAKAHGGRLSVESALGEGTTFTLSLPPVAEHNDARRLQPPLPNSLSSGEER